MEDKIRIEALKTCLAEHGMPIRGVYERSDAKVRLLEGMERSGDKIRRKKIYYVMIRFLSPLNCGLICFILQTQSLLFIPVNL